MNSSAVAGVAACAIGVFFCVSTMLAWQRLQVVEPTNCSRANVPFVGHQPGSISRISVVVLAASVLPDADSARCATRNVKSRTLRTEANLNIIGSFILA